MIFNVSLENASGPAVIPMWSISGLRSLLGINEDKILELIESNRLPWAFDCGLGRRMELRLMPQSVAAFQAAAPCTLTWEEVEKQMVPPSRLGVIPKINGLFLQRVLNISCTHLAALIECGQMQAVREGRPGKGNSTEVSAASFLQFLKRKRFR